VSYRRLVPAAALVLVVVAAGCGGTSGPTAKELVTQSIAATSAVKTFHLAVDIENVPAPRTGLGLTSVDGDVIVPDRLHGRVSGTFLGLSLSTDLVVVGHDYFLKVPFTGKWRKIDVSTLPSAFFDPKKGILAVIDGASDIARDGSEDVGGVPCYRLKGTVQADTLKALLGGAEGTQPLTLELWVGKDDKLLRRLRLTGPVAPNESADSVRTVELSAFDEPVQIVAPSVS
jgi:hypothetical protein